jgi:hypothetical protein
MMRLWPGMFVAPLAFLAELSLAYALVPYACQSERHATIHALQIVTLAVTVGAALLALREYRVAGGETPDDAGDKMTRDRFVALLGVLISVTISLALLAQWITTWVIPPCVR